MKFKIGDKVKVKSWEQVTNHIELSKIIWETLGDIYTITRVQSESVYTKELSVSLPIEALIKIEESTFTPTFKYKVGDIVQIKSLDWYYANKTKDGCVPTPLNYNNSFVEEMAKYCGKQYIVKLKNDYNYTLVDLDNKETIKWAWQDYMFEDSIIEGKEIMEESYPINSIITIGNDKYIVTECSEKNFCERCTFAGIAECEEIQGMPDNYVCSSALRKDNKNTYLKKVDKDASNIETDPYPIDSIVEIDNIKYTVTETNVAPCPNCDCRGLMPSCPINTRILKDFHCSHVLRKDKTNIYLKKIPMEVDKYAIGNTFTSNGNTYIVVENPKGGCIGCDLLNAGECFSNKPKGFECLRSLRSDDKYVIAKKITPNDSKSEETPIDNNIVIIEGIPCIVVSNSGCTKCTFYDYTINSCSESRLCSLEGGESYQRVNSFPTTIGMYGNLNNIDTGVGLVEQREVANESYNTKEEVVPKKSLNSNILSKESLLQIEEIPTITISKEIQLGSIIIEYGVL